MLCSWVDVVATKPIPAGSEMLLNYGDRPLRDFLQGYGFVPAGHTQEVRRRTALTMQPPPVIANWFRMPFLLEGLPSPLTVGIPGQH